MVVTALVLVPAAAILIGFLVQPDPIDDAITALDRRGYTFVADDAADPAISIEDATASAVSDSVSREASAGPVRGFVTYDGPGEGGDLERKPVYLFVIEGLTAGPVITDGPPPTPHAVLVFGDGAAQSLTAVPLRK